MKNLRITLSPHCYSTNSSTKESGDGDVESLLSLMPFMPPTIYFVFCYVLAVSFGLPVEM
jgi:hypothetical protein